MLLPGRILNIKGLLPVLVIMGLLFSCSLEEMGLGVSSPAMDYRQEMRRFVQSLSAYAKNSRSNFIVVPQNGVELVSTTGNAAGKPVEEYLAAIDGIGQEELFYGYEATGVETPQKETRRLGSLLDMARKSGATILVTDYCLDRDCIVDSQWQNNARGYLSFATTQRELDSIPVYPAGPPNLNANTITHLSEAGNFLYLINPDRFSSPQNLLDAVAVTDFDLVILDFFFHGEPYSAAQIDKLKRKGNGGRRLLLAYMSIGEAEDYRFYWQDGWRDRPPVWLREENPDWAGNYLVEYWQPQWQKIIYGNADAYLDRIMAAGFDGVYLDIIDAYEYFEDRH